jgi:hypothetical protein
MASTPRQVNVRAKDPYRFNASNWKTKDQWRKWERVGMDETLELDRLLLNWADKRVWDLEIKNAIEGITINRTIEGANTVEITLRDPHNVIFKEAMGRARRKIHDPSVGSAIDEAWNEINQVDVIGRAVEVQLDECAFRLVKVGRDTTNSQTVLTFEDRMIYWLRRKKGHSLRVSRSQVTRAMFILRLLRQVDVEKLPFICPELHEKQLIGSIKKTKSTKASGDPDNKGAFDGKAKLTLKGKRATASQRRNMAKAFQAAEDQKGMTNRVLQALACTVIVESMAGNPPGGDADSRGILQVQDRTARYRHVDNTSISSSVIGWCNKGYGTSGMGAIEYAKAHPQASPGLIAAATQYLASNEHLYQQHAAEAKKWVTAWSGTAGSETSGEGTYVKSYQYARAKNEDSWTCMTRLAEEVNWRVFIVGRSFYFMSEEQLYERRVRHLVKPTDDAAISLTSDMDWGKPYNEAELTVQLGRWDAPPGSVIELEGWGAEDGRWLVFSSSRDWFSPLCTLSLRQPGGEKREPPPEVVSSGKSDSEDDGDSSKAGKYWEYANLVSKNTPTYLLGAGHGDMSHISSSSKFDCSSSTSWALWKAGMWPKGWGNTARVSGAFTEWGHAGKGEKITLYCNAGHVFTEFEEGSGHGGKRFDTGGGGNYPRGARIKSGHRPHGGFTARHWPGT